MERYPLGVILRHGIEVEYNKMNAATHHVLAHALASHISKSILSGLPVAIIAIGAADNIDLPDAIQHVVTRLDVTWWILPKGIPGEGTPAFLHWALPLNAVFYSFLAFLFLLWRSPLPSKAKPKLKKVGNTTTLSPPTLDPNNSKLPALTEILDRNLLLQQLSLLPIFQRTSALRDVEVSVMRSWGNGRAVVGISLRSGILGKVYATNRQDVYQFMVALQQAGFDRAADFSIPQPIAYLPSLNLLLQEHVEGPIASKVLKHDDDERVCVGAAEQCGRWLGTFHSRAPRRGQVQEFVDFLADLEKRGQALLEAGRPFAGKTKRLMESLRAAPPGPGTVKLCAGHGDFGPYQVVLAPKRTAVFDWDGFDVGDPTRDIARFVVSLEMRAFSRRSYRMDACIAAFLEAYFAAGGQPEAAVRLPFYKAATYLRRAGRIGRWRRPGWQEQAERCVDAALLTLREIDITPAVP